MKKIGKVYLIGAGPGDVGLFTIRGKDCINKADIIVYDYLVNPKILEFAQINTEIIYVGKRSGHKELSQTKINKLLVDKAKRGKLVARLKGGDPFIFGRGAEEALELSKNKIPYEIIPGISSDYAVPEYAGIPPTHRDYSSTIAVITGHEDPKKKRTKIPWSSLGKISTLIFLMGINKLDKIVDKLRKNGKSSNTPVAVITWGTYPAQKTVVGSLKNIIGKTIENRVKPPGIIVVGEVVKLREQIQWYEKKPLYGKNILITRPKRQASEFINGLNELGANTIEFPTIQISHPKSWSRLDKAIKRITEYNWIIFTSTNGVSSFFNRLKYKNLGFKSLSNIKFAVIGKKTKQSLEDHGLSADIIPDEFRAEGLIKEFQSADLIGKRILIPRAKEARQILPEKLKRLGANVDVVTAYENKIPESLNSKKLIDEIKKSDIDVITFTSPSTVNNFYSVFKTSEKTFKNSLIASIGPITTEALRSHGKEPEIAAKEYTTKELTKEILNYFIDA